MAQEPRARVEGQAGKAVRSGEVDRLGGGEGPWKRCPLEVIGKQTSDHGQQWAPHLRRETGGTANRAAAPVLVEKGSSPHRATTLGTGGQSVD